MTAQLSTKRLVRTMAVGCFGMTLALATQTFSADPPKPGDKPADKAAMPGMDDAMMKQMMEMAKPGEQHKTLAMMAGNWKVENHMQMAPGAPEQVSTGECTKEMIMDGRYLVEHLKAEMMGMPFTGMGVTGYDNMQKKFNSTWCDSMGTGIMRAEGECDATGKVMTYKTEMPDPMNGGKMMPVKYVVTVVSPDQHTFQWYEMHDGKEACTMTITYNRAK